MLGPLTKLAPGEKILHEESWELYDRLDQPFLPGLTAKTTVGDIRPISDAVCNPCNVFRQSRLVCLARLIHNEPY